MVRPRSTALMSSASALPTWKLDFVVSAGNWSGLDSTERPQGEVAMRCNTWDC